MATVASLIEDTRRLLFSGQREERNKLALSILSSTTGLKLTYPAGQITRGAKLSIELEDIYAWEINPADPLHVFPIDRGQWGSTAIGHTAGATIHVNPKFSNWEIFNAINTEINSLSSPLSGLYQVQSAELTYNSSIQGYDLTGFPIAAQNIQDILEVRYTVPGASREYPLSTDWELSRSMSDEFTAGMALFVRDAYPGSTVVVKGKFGFSQLAASLVADASTTGIDPIAYDIIAIGAAWRLASGLEVSRNFATAQGDTRRSQEVPPGANLGGARELGRMRSLRIAEEAARLAGKYPRITPRYPYLANYG